MTLAELTREYGLRLNALRRDEEDERLRLDEWLNQEASKDVAGRAALQQLNDATTAASLRRSDLIETARAVARDAAVKEATKRSAALGTHEDAFRIARDKAETDYRRARDKARRDYEEALREIEEKGRAGKEGFALHEQHRHRDAALRAYEKQLADAKILFDQAWDDAWGKMQTDSRASLRLELLASEEAIAAEARAVEDTSRDYERQIKNAKSVYFNLLERALPAAVKTFYERRTEIGRRHEQQRDALSAWFKSEREKIDS